MKLQEILLTWEYTHGESFLDYYESIEDEEGFYDWLYENKHIGKKKYENLTVNLTKIERFERKFEGYTENIT